MTFALTFPAIDPVLIAVGPFQIRWYALAYIFGLLIAWRLARAMATRRPKVATAEAVDDFLVWATLGVVLGGRLFAFLGCWLFVPGSLRGCHLFGIGLLFSGWLLVLAWMLGLLCHNFLFALTHAAIA